MFPIKTPTRQVDKWGPGNDGFTDGNPQTGLASTQLESAWFDIMQEEVANAVRLAGIPLSPPVEGGPNHGLGDLTQLYQAINAIAGGLNPDLSGFVRKSGDTMTGGLTINVSGGGGLRLASAAALDSQIYIYVGTQGWSVGCQGAVNPGEFWIYDLTVGAMRLAISASGLVFIPQGLSVGPVTAHNGINVAGGLGVSYQWTPPHIFGFGWTGTHVEMMVDGQSVGLIATTTALGAYLPLTGGQLAGPGDLLVHGRLDCNSMLVVAGNFSAPANGELAVTNTIRCGADLTCSNIGAAGNITGGSVTAAGGLVVQSGGASITGGVNVPGGGIISAGALEVQSGGAAIEGRLTARGAIIYAGAGFDENTLILWPNQAACAYTHHINPTGTTYWTVGSNQVSNFTISRVAVTYLQLHENTDFSVPLSTNAYKPGTPSWNTPLDLRLNRDIAPYDRGLAEIRQLQPISFAYNGRGGLRADGRRYQGIAAQDALPIMPEMVGEWSMRLEDADEDETSVYTMDYHPLLMALVNGVKELADRLERLEGGRLLGRPGLPAGDED